MAYHGELWPELGRWAPDLPTNEMDEEKRVGKRRRAEREGAIGLDGSGSGGTGVLFSPYVPPPAHRLTHQLIVQKGSSR
jgi:hypothetical protein